MVGVKKRIRSDELSLWCWLCRLPYCGPVVHTAQPPLTLDEAQAESPMTSAEAAREAEQQRSEAERWQRRRSMSSSVSPPIEVHCKVLRRLEVRSCRPSRSTVWQGVGCSRLAFREAGQQLSPAPQPLHRARLNSVHVNRLTPYLWDTPDPPSTPPVNRPLQRRVPGPPSTPPVNRPLQRRVPGTLSARPSPGAAVHQRYRPERRHGWGQRQRRVELSPKSNSRHPPP